MTFAQKCWRAFLGGWFGGFVVAEIHGLARGEVKEVALLALMFVTCNVAVGVAIMISSSVRRCACGHTLDMHAGFWPGRGACWAADCRCDRSVRLPEARVGR